VAGTLEHQQQAATHHIAQSTVGLFPLPRLTKFLRQRAAALLRVGRDQIPDIKDVVAADQSAPILELLHSAAVGTLFFWNVRGKNCFSHFAVFTRRHIGAARTRDTSPAAISSCAS